MLQEHNHAYKQLICEGIQIRIHNTRVEFY